MVDVRPETEPYGVTVVVAPDVQVTMHADDVFERVAAPADVTLSEHASAIAD